MALARRAGQPARGCDGRGRFQGRDARLGPVDRPLDLPGSEPGRDRALSAGPVPRSGLDAPPAWRRVTLVVNAAPQDQWRLLDVQANDTKLAQIAHRRRTLPELAELDRLTARLSELEDRIVEARTRVGDIEREGAQPEADV